MSAPATLRLGSSVLVSGAILREALYVLALGCRERDRRDGLPPSSRLRYLMSVLAEAAAEDELMSRSSDVQSARSPAVSRHGDMECGLDSPDFEVSVMRCHELTSREAAAVLGVGQRQVQRLASLLGGRRAPSGRLLFDTLAVQAYATRRGEGGWTRDE